MAGDGNRRNVERRSFLKATGAAGAAVALSGITAATPGRDPGPKENELLVGVSNATSMQVAEAEVGRAMPAQAEVAHKNEDLNYMAVSLPEVASAEAKSRIKEAMERRPGIRYVEDNATHHVLSTPNDPRFSDQYAPQQVKAPTAWETESGSNATVAVVDQGVKYDEPDLQAQFGSDKGKDFVDGDGDPIPESLSNEYHGTHVAGITAATRNNNEGVAGISDANLISCRALGTSGGSTADIADAIQYATDRGADIINMSLGGGGFTQTMKNAVSYAVNNGALPICAAGNSGNEGVSYPAKYDECVAVGAVDESENLASFSQYGTDLDIVAPGVNVLSTWTERNTEYNRISGTSMACPAASGVAALGKSNDTSLSPTDLRGKLKDTADDIGLSQNRQGAGRVNAAAIVSGGGGNSAPTVSIDASSATVTAGQDVTFDGSASSDSDGSISSYQWDFGDGTTATGAQVTHAFSSAGDYTVSLTVTDDDGASSTDSVAVTVEPADGGNSAPTVSIDASSATVTAGQDVTFDGSASSDSDGSISSYQWDFGDGTTATGAQVTHAFASAGDYTVSLTVTDNDGASSTDSVAVTVESAGGTCGDASESAQGSGYLYGYYDSTAFTYPLALSNPCQVTVSISGAYNTDFDLYVTTDGRVPTTDDYDVRSITPDSDEAIILDDVSGGQEIGILVDSYRGSGDFRVSVEEIGK